METKKVENRKVGGPKLQSSFVGNFVPCVSPAMLIFCSHQLPRHGLL